MNEANAQNRPRWFQFSLRALLILVLVAAAYFAGFSTSQKLAEKALIEAREKATAELGKAQEAALQAQMQAEQARLRAVWPLANRVLTK